MAEFSNKDVFKQHVIIVDEVDMVANEKNGFRGASAFMNSFFFYGSTANSLTLKDYENFGRKKSEVKVMEVDFE